MLIHIIIENFLKKKFVSKVVNLFEEKKFKKKVKIALVCCPVTLQPQLQLQLQLHQGIIYSFLFQSRFNLGFMLQLQIFGLYAKYS